MTPRDRRQDGWTLIEILIVLGIVAVLFGMGAGVFISLTESGRRKAAQEEVINLFRKASNAAVGEQRSAVVIEDGGSRLRGMIQRTVGTWHCEDLQEGTTTGAGRQDGAVTMGELEPNGKIGQAIRLRNGWIDCGRYPGYDATDGVGASLWVRPESRSPMALLEKGRSWKLWIEPGGRSLVARAFVRVGRGESSEQLVELVGEKAPVPLGRWTEVSFTFDRTLALLFVNGIEVDRYEAGQGEDVGAAEDGEDETAVGEEKPKPMVQTRRIVPDRQAPLTIGSDLDPIDGFVDDVRVTGILSGDVVELPEGMILEGETTMIRFRNGWLDQSSHAGPVDLRFRVGNRVRRIRIGMNGLPVRQ
jgi:prepilin-type N-terminal cleavage/methylation domain-containing protein